MRSQAFSKRQVWKTITQTQVSWLIPRIFSTTENTASKFFFMLKENLTPCSIHSFGHSGGKNVENIDSIIYIQLFSF